MPAECSPPEKTFWVYVSLWIANFFSPLLYSGVTTILPSIAHDFHTSAATISLIVMLFAYSQGFIGTIGGRMSDLFGLRKMMTIGFIICFLTLIGLFISTNFTMLSIFRCIQGIGTALLISSSTAIAINITPIYKRGTILGVLTSAAYLGASLGPIIGGAVATFLGWRFLFLLLMIPSIVGLILFRGALRLEWCTLDEEKFDTKGAIMLGLGTGAISLGAGLFSLYHPLLYLVPLGILFLIIFVYMQKHTRYPIININLFTKSGKFSLGIISIMINFGAATAFVYYSTMYFQQVRGFTPLMAGFFLLFKSIAQFAFTPYAGKLSDKIHPEYIIIVGIILCTISLIGTAYLNQTSSIYYIYTTLFLSGLGLAIFSAPSTVSALQDIPSKEIAVASSLTATSRSMGILSSQIIVSLSISHYLGKATVNFETIPAFLNSMKTSFLAMSFVNIICLICYIILAIKIHHIDVNKQKIKE